MIGHSKGTIAKIGMVNFIIAAPIYETFKRTVIHKRWELVEGSPALLNKKLAEGELDLGLVSSFEYGQHPDKYNILSGLSMSATGSVEGAGSVFLFSHVPLQQLDQVEVLLCSQSDTAARLAKIILEEFIGVVPVYTSGDVTAGSAASFKAVLAIGDDALRLVAKSTYLYQFDLVDIWKRETGLPFVFAVCAVRQDFCLQDKKLVDEIHRELLRCRDEGVNAIDEICSINAPRIPMSVSGCCDYLRTVEYNLDEKKQNALTTFFDFLIRRGEIGKDCLPLKVYSNII